MAGACAQELDILGDKGLELCVCLEVFTHLGNLLGRNVFGDIAVIFPSLEIAAGTLRGLSNGGESPFFEAPDAGDLLKDILWSG